MDALAPILIITILALAFGALRDAMSGNFSRPSGSTILIVALLVTLSVILLSGVPSNSPLVVALEVITFLGLIVAYILTRSPSR
jgi:hypothetical protein